MEILLVLVWLGCGLAAGSIAGVNGRSGCGGFLIGVLLGPIGLAIVLLMGISPEHAKALDALSMNKRACPSCREMIAFDAKICAFCRTAFSEEQVQEAIEDRAFRRKLQLRNLMLGVGSLLIVLLILLFASR